MAHKKCVEGIRLVKEPVCKKCGKMLILNQVEYCFDCRRIQHEFVQGRAVFAYEGEIKRSIFEYKYKNKREFADFYIYGLYFFQKEWIKQKNFDLCLPIPIHKSRLKVRGFNQAALIARGLAERTGIPYDEDVLFRKKRTVAQKELNVALRRENLRDAFGVYGGWLNAKRVLVVDDIYTTGATMDCVASTLKKSGVREVYCLSLCIGSGQ